MEGVGGLGEVVGAAEAVGGAGAVGDEQPMVAGGRIGADGQGHEGLVAGGLGGGDGEQVVVVGEVTRTTRRLRLPFVAGATCSGSPSAES